MPEMRRVPVDPKRRSKRQPADLATFASEEQPEEPEGCACPVLDAEDWHDAESDWSDIAFLKSSTTAVMGVPFGYQSTRDELRAKAKQLELELPEDGMVLLGQGKFRRPVMLEIDVTQGTRGPDIFRPGGVAYTRLVPGRMGSLGKLVDEALGMALGKYGRKPDNTWLWYLTCRHCSEARGFETLIVCHYKEKK